MCCSFGIVVQDFLFTVIWGHVRQQYTCRKSRSFIWRRTSFSDKLLENKLVKKEL